MPKIRIFPALRHAATMVGRTIRSYAMLSVTIVLSLSLLLGYMLFTDSSIYNEYKQLFSKRRGDVTVATYVKDSAQTEIFLRELDEMEQTSYFISYLGDWGHLEGKYYIADAPADVINITNLKAFLVPDYAWLDGMEQHLGKSSSDIVWIDGRERADFVLNADEVIVCEAFYYYFGMYNEASPMFVLNGESGPGVSLRVVGYLKNDPKVDWRTDVWHDFPTVVLSTKLIETANLYNEEIWNSMSSQRKGVISRQYIAVHSETPEAVTKLAQDLNFEHIYEVAKEQDAARAVIRSEVKNKAVISCALLLLLGVNLYSCFTNALNERRFEIGVKRAIGASGWSVVRQFFYESLLVMLANIGVSVALVVDIFVLYKYIYDRTPDEFGYYHTWTTYISPYSMGMFAICALSLTVVFSLIFAYKATKVEIIQYLKAE